MAKIVRYNGENRSYYSCSSPDKLIIGATYEVTKSIVKNSQTDYVLKGIDGEFNSVWFDEVLFEKKAYIAVSNEIPIVGSRYICQKINYAGENVKLTKIRTSIIKSVTCIGNNIYNVKTANTFYIVSVSKK